VTSELGPEELAVLARARRGLSPSARDAARVRASVDAAVTAGSSAPLGRESGRDVSAAPGTAIGAAKLGAVVALAAATGFGGYVLGFRAGAAEREQRRTPPAVAAHVAPPSPVVAAPLAEIRALPRDPSLDAAQPARVPKSERLAPSANGSAGIGANPRATPPPADAHESSLELETRLLARVERALRDDNARLALGLLGELDRTVPGGQLAEERQAARAMGHCALGSDSAQKLARAFVEAHASSAYVPRVREACRATLEEKDAP